MIPALLLLLGCGEPGPAAKDLSDADGDGFAAGDDCDDGNKNIHPGASDIVGDGIDHNCDGVDGVDADGDGSASEDSGGDDCDDQNAGHLPGAADTVGDGIDQNCDGLDGVDADGDGSASEDSGGDDCNDADPQTSPLAVDTFGDGIDQDCDGFDGVDADADGYASRDSGGEDCDDADADINPDAEEIWYDDIDQDCARDCDWDQDLDGYFDPGVPPVDNGPCDLDPTAAISLPLDCDDLDPAANANVLVEVYPADGELDAYYRTTVEATTSQAEAGTTVDLFDALGAPVAGVSTLVNNTMTFVPDVPLNPLSTYTGDVTWSCGTQQWTFTTSDLGDMAAPDVIDGHTYLVDLASGRWIEPPGIGPLLGTLIDASLLLDVQTSDPDLSMLFALEDTNNPGTQDLCIETHLSTPVPFVDNPFFTIDAFSFGIGDGAVLDLEDGLLSGSFAPDGSSIGGIVFEADLDTRPLVPVIGLVDPYALCALAVAVGINCAPCPSDGALACVNMHVDSIVANEIPNLNLVPRTGMDITADPNCP